MIGRRTLRLAVCLALGAGPAAAQRPCAVLARSDCAPPAYMMPASARAGLAARDTVPELPDRWLGSDKLKHFFLSFGTTGFAWAGAELAGAGDAARRVGPLVAAAAGIGKELSDRAHGWGFSVRDLAWDAAGIALAFVALRDTG